ncbi:MAG: class I SAM-dependent methyltransferase [Alphaproteobacteria bacterium]|nr:class I SAM-dependent methyltransferase [Alphaproteobacteria bacterium]
MSDHFTEIELTQNILKDMGIELNNRGKILDFGCGAGTAVSALGEQGYQNVYGYDIQNYLNLDIPNDPSHFFFSSKEIETHYNSFDFIFSNQVLEHVTNYSQTLQQIYDLLKPGGICLHFFPSKWRIVEPHIFVPFAGVFSSKTYLGFWSKLGIRNQFQKGKPWRDVQEENYNFCLNNLNYLSTGELYREFKVLFKRVEFREDLFIKHSKGRLQKIPKIIKALPGLAFLMRELHARTVFLQKL